MSSSSRLKVNADVLNQFRIHFIIKIDHIIFPKYTKKCTKPLPMSTVVFFFSSLFSFFYFLYFCFMSQF